VAVQVAQFGTPKNPATADVEQLIQAPAFKAYPAAHPVIVTTAAAAVQVAAFVPHDAHNPVVVI
jgi:hypothetical protein